MCSFRRPGFDSSSVIGRCKVHNKASRRLLLASTVLIFTIERFIVVVFCYQNDANRISCALCAAELFASITVLFVQLLKSTIVGKVLSESNIRSRSYITLQFYRACHLQLQIVSCNATITYVMLNSRNSYLSR